MVNEFKLTLADQEYLKQKIAQAEKLTQAEIIVGVTRRSSDYNLAALVIAVIASVALMTGLVMLNWWPFSFVSFQLAQIAIALSLYMFLIESGLVCHFVPDLYLRRAVRRMAREMFYDDDLQGTQNRNALLIFVSLRERRMELLPDKSLQQTVPFHIWDELLQLALRRKAKENLVNWLGDTVVSCARVLKAYDPVKGENPNEIANNVRFV